VKMCFHSPHYAIGVPTLLQMATIASIVPLCMYLSFREDFTSPGGNRLNPLLPHHFITIATTAWKALSSNNFKVAEKDL
jgi:hypothetical protein